MTQRLALNHILKNQLRDAFHESDNNRQNRKLASATKQEKAVLRFAASRSNPTAHYFGDVRKLCDRMVANVHSTIRATPPPRKSVPSIPAPIAQIPNAGAGSAGKQRSKSAQGRIRGGGSGARSGGGVGVMPIAAIKASLDQKAQRLLKRGLNNCGSGKNFEDRRRIREVLQQKSMLENMLLQHKRLQHDRQTIAMDIKRMRLDLDRIRNKLDTSLQSLNSTRTLFSATNSTISRKGSSAAKPKQLRHTPRPSTHKMSNSAATRRHTMAPSKLHASHPVLRSGAVTLKRQLAIAPTKTRRGRS
ncbi:uncharacterized protein [Drosophila tropicalis]|uniref:uncharacterized protein n=1 Tax=Drosophila tropicalis TaxID=46794 RepID=UPI0035ABCFC9